MIIGQGIDMVDIRRVARMLERYGSRFTRRVFTPHERDLAGRRPLQAETLAKRLAAKEACAKALGTGIWRQGVYWPHMGVVNAQNGRPSLQLSGGAAAQLATMIPAGMESLVHLGLSDEYPYALAQVIIEANPVRAAS